MPAALLLHRFSSRKEQMSSSAGRARCSPPPPSFGKYSRVRLSPDEDALFRIRGEWKGWPVTRVISHGGCRQTWPQARAEDATPLRCLPVVNSADNRPRTTVPTELGAARPVPASS